MCKLSDWFRGKPKEEEKPDWVTQTREEVAEEEEYAASIHYAWMIAIEEGRMTPQEIDVGGDCSHHEHWWRKHQEAAWYIRNPKE